jgi:hypothetical protein
MNRDKLKASLPTIMAFWERREQRLRNQLPRHLRPLPSWPIWLQIALNIGIAITLASLMANRDEFFSEAVPAMGMVICLLLCIYTLISAVQLKSRYLKTPLHKLAQINLWLMIIAFLMLPASVSYFLP